MSIKYRLFVIMILCLSGQYTVYGQLNPTNGILYVTENGKGKKDGSSWGNACAQLADPLIAARVKNSEIKEIWVAAGSYNPHYTVDGNTTTDDRQKTFVVPEKVSIYGGFPADPIDGIDYRNENHDSRDIAANPTILQGNNACHVLIAVANSFKSSITIDGFTITGGNANGSIDLELNGEKISASFGAGVFAYTAPKNGIVTLRNNTIRDNNAVANIHQSIHSGGSVQDIVEILEGFKIEIPDFLDSLIVYLQNHPITLSVADAKGAGVYAQGTVVISNNKIIDNSLSSHIDENDPHGVNIVIAHGQGAALFADGTVTFSENVISSNTMNVTSRVATKSYNIDMALANGAGAYLVGDVNGENNKFENNSAYADARMISLIKGGVVYLEKNSLFSKATFENNTIKSNMSQSKADIVALTHGGIVFAKKVDLKNNQVLNNTAHVIGDEFVVTADMVNNLMDLLGAVLAWDANFLERAKDLFDDILPNIPISFANMQGGMIYMDQTTAKQDTFSNNTINSNAKTNSSVSGGVAFMKKAHLKQSLLANNTTDVDSKGFEINFSESQMQEIVDLLDEGGIPDWILDALVAIFSLFDDFDIFVYMANIQGGEIYTKDLSTCENNEIHSNKALANVNVRKNSLVNYVCTNVEGGVVYSVDSVEMKHNVITDNRIESMNDNNDGIVNVAVSKLKGGVFFIQKGAHLLSNTITSNTITVEADSDDDGSNKSNGLATLQGGAIYLSLSEGEALVNSNTVSRNEMKVIVYNDDTNESGNVKDVLIQGGAIYAYPKMKKIKMIGNDITENSMYASTDDDDDVSYLSAEGAGIYALVDSVGSSVHIISNTIKNNMAKSYGYDDGDDSKAYPEAYGGGIALAIKAENSFMIIKDNTIENNNATSNLASDAKIEGKAKSYGGGIYGTVAKGSLEITENRIRGNTLHFIHDGVGVGMALIATENGQISVNDNEITGNIIDISKNDANGNDSNDDLTSNAFGGGIYMDARDGIAEIARNTISQNRMLVKTYVKAIDRAETETNIHGGGLYAKGLVAIVQNEIRENYISARATSLDADKDDARAYNYGGGVYVSIDDAANQIKIERNRMIGNVIETISVGDDDAGNKGNNKAVSKGGGMCIQADKGEVRMLNNYICQNAISTSLSEDDAKDDTDARAEGGGVFIFVGEASISLQGDTMTNNTLHALTEKNDNFAYSYAYGGGLSIESQDGGAASAIMVDKLYVSENSLKACSEDSYHDDDAKVEGLGGGIFLDVKNSSTTITNSLIVNNSTYGSVDRDNDKTPEAFSYGGGVYVRSGSVNMFNNTIAGNSSQTGTTHFNPSEKDREVSLTKKGGGIYVYRGNVLLQNGIVWGNKLGNDDQDIEKNENATVTLKNVLTKENDITHGASVITTSTSPFVDFDDQDFRLAVGSSAIDFGSMDGLPALNMDLDLARSPRVLLQTIDLGAFEFNPIPFEVLDTVICLGSSIGVALSPIKTPCVIYYSTGNNIPHTVNISSSPQICAFTPSITTHYQIDSMLLGNPAQRYVFSSNQPTWTIEVIEVGIISKSNTDICYGETANLLDRVVINPQDTLLFFADRAATTPICNTQTPQDTTTYYFIVRNELTDCECPIDSIAVNVKSAPIAEIVNEYEITLSISTPVALEINRSGVGEFSLYFSENGISQAPLTIHESESNPYIYNYAIAHGDALRFIVLDSVVDLMGCMVSIQDTFTLYVVDCATISAFNPVCPDTMVVLPAYGDCEFTFDQINGPNLTLAERYLINIGFLSLTNNLPADLTFPQGIHEVAWYWENDCGEKDTVYQWVIVNYPPCNSMDTVWMIDEHKNIYYELDSLFAQDFDGNRYRTARIGCDCWLADNMKTTKTANGTRVESYIYTSSFYPNTTENLNKYGRLYDWQNASLHGEIDTDGDICGICPEGWHLPSVSHYEQMLTYSTADLFEQDSWLPSVSATNATGLSLLPGGIYDSKMNRFSFLWGDAYFWTTEELTSTRAITACFLYSCPTIFFNVYQKKDGMSVRCVKK